MSAHDPDDARFYRPPSAPVSPRGPKYLEGFPEWQRMILAAYGVGRLTAIVATALGSWAATWSWLR